MNEDLPEGPHRTITDPSFDPKSGRTKIPTPKWKEQSSLYILGKGPNFRVHYPFGKKKHTKTPPSFGQVPGEARRLYEEVVLKSVPNTPIPMPSEHLMDVVFETGSVESRNFPRSLRMLQPSSLLATSLSVHEYMIHLLSPLVLEHVNKCLDEEEAQKKQKTVNSENNDFFDYFGDEIVHEHSNPLDREIKPWKGVLFEGGKRTDSQTRRKPKQNLNAPRKPKSTPKKPKKIIMRGLDMEEEEGENEEDEEIEDEEMNEEDENFLQENESESQDDQIENIIEEDDEYDDIDDIEDPIQDDRDVIDNQNNRFEENAAFYDTGYDDDYDLGQDDEYEQESDKESNVRKSAKKSNREANNKTKTKKTGAKKASLEQLDSPDDQHINIGTRKSKRLLNLKKAASTRATRKNNSFDEFIRELQNEENEAQKDDHQNNNLQQDNDETDDPHNATSVVDSQTGIANSSSDASNQNLINFETNRRERANRKMSASIKPHYDEKVEKLRRERAERLERLRREKEERSRIFHAQRQTRARTQKEERYRQAIAREYEEDLSEEEKRRRFLENLNDSVSTRVASDRLPEDTLTSQSVNYGPHLNVDNMQMNQDDTRQQSSTFDFDRETQFDPAEIGPVPASVYGLFDPFYDPDGFQYLTYDASNERERRRRRRDDSGVESNSEYSQPRRSQRLQNNAKSSASVTNSSQKRPQSSNSDDNSLMRQANKSLSRQTNETFKRPAKQPSNNVATISQENVEKQQNAQPNSQQNAQQSQTIQETSQQHQQQAANNSDQSNSSMEPLIPLQPDDFMSGPSSTLQAQSGFGLSSSDTAVAPEIGMSSSSSYAMSLILDSSPEMNQKKRPRNVAFGDQLSDLEEPPRWPPKTYQEESD